MERINQDKQTPTTDCKMDKQPSKCTTDHSGDSTQSQILRFNQPEADRVGDQLSKLAVVAGDTVRPTNLDYQANKKAVVDAHKPLAGTYSTTNQDPEGAQYTHSGTIDSASYSHASCTPTGEALQSHPDPAHKHKCAYCGRLKAFRICGGCNNAPEKAGIMYTAPSYCGKVCQIAHWSTHKKDCKTRQADKQVQALFRAGHLITELFFIWREACYDRPVVNVEVKNNSIYVYEDWFASKTFCSGGRHRPLNKALFNDDDIKKAVLANMGCDVSLAFIQKVFYTFLEEITVSIEEVEVVIKDNLRPIYIIDTANGQYQLQGPHHVLRVALKNGNFWAIDITAAQFGWDEIVAPWTEYLYKHCQHVLMVEDFGSRSAFFQQMIDKPGTAGDDVRAFATWTRCMGDMLGEIVRRALEGNTMNVGGLLSYSEEKWRRKENSLLQLVGEAMVAAVQEGDRMWGEQASNSG